MSNLQAILDQARASIGIQRWLYDEWPLTIAARLGAPEVREIIERLDALEQERDSLPDWDGDGADDVWRMQRNYGRLLSAVAGRHPAEVSRGLESPCAGTRRWTASAIQAAPGPAFIGDLEDALAAERDAHTARVLAEALAACRKRPSFFGKLFGG